MSLQKITEQGGRCGSPGSSSGCGNATAWGGGVYLPGNVSRRAGSRKAREEQTRSLPLTVKGAQREVWWESEDRLCVGAGVGPHVLGSRFFLRTQLLHPSQCD